MKFCYQWSEPMGMNSYTVFLHLTSNNVQQLPGGGHHQDPVMSGVRYGQSFAAVVYCHFSRERQDAGR